MSMQSYIREIQRQFIAVYRFTENTEKPGTLNGVAPDGDYPMVIDGKLDMVCIKNGKISCCNFDALTVGELRQRSALAHADRPVMPVVKDEELQKLLGGRKLRIVSAYPDTTHPDGHMVSTFKIEVALI